MIKSIKVTNKKKDSKEFILDKGIESGFLITKISGLGPVEADVSVSNVVTFDGGVYNSARAKTRNIVIEFALHGNDVEAQRLELYKYFPLKEKVTIEVKTGTRHAATYGYIERVEPEIFEETQHIQISIVCPDSYFTDIQNGVEKLYSFYAISPNFEFPFSNESLTTALLEFGIIRGNFVHDIYYTGEVETGFVMSFSPFGDLNKKIRISNVDTGENMTIDLGVIQKVTGKAFSSSDELSISTIKGYKYVLLSRAGKTYNVLNCLDRSSDWLQLSQGHNKFAYAITDDPNQQVRFEIRTTNLLFGV